ncbi:hypothetical protein Efla_003935 [Eimeria flavescens]
MDQYECPVCNANCFLNPDRLLYSSEVCSHRLCEPCLLSQFGDLTGGASATAKGACPVCRRPLTRANYVLTEPDVELFEYEKDIRKRVNSVLNALRDNFENTPAYNDYLEEKEETIYELVHGTDEQIKRKLESRLRELEGHGRAQQQQKQQKQQQQQQQNSEARAALRLRKIKEIVSKEGNFYEIVKRKPLGRPLKATEEPYLHVLERQYFSLFHSDRGAGNQRKSGASSLDGARPLEAAIREDHHIPKRRYASMADFMAAGEAAAYTPELHGTRGLEELRGVFFGL